MKSPQRDAILNELRNIIIETLHNHSIDVYLFGSWARNEEKNSSDIDIALQSANDIPMDKWVILHDKIEESTIPYHVDLVNLAHTDSDFRKKVMEEGILWTD